MPAALTMEQKVLRAEAKKASIQVKESGTTVPTPQIRKAPERSQRITRGVFNGTRGKLTIPEQDVRNFEEAGWHLHIFNDTPGRIEEALLEGYEFVTRDEIGGVVANVVDGNTDLGEKIRFRVNQANTNDEGHFAYLMKIPKADWYDNQELLQKRNESIDAAIKAGKNTKAGDSAEGFYNAGIKTAENFKF